MTTERAKCIIARRVGMTRHFITFVDIWKEMRHSHVLSRKLDSLNVNVITKFLTNEIYLSEIFDIWYTFWILNQRYNGSIIFYSKSNSSYTFAVEAVSYEPIQTVASKWSRDVNTWGIRMTWSIILFAIDDIWKRKRWNQNKRFQVRMMEWFKKLDTTVRYFLLLCILEYG